MPPEEPMHYPFPRAYAARKIREVFDTGATHSGTWGRMIYVGPGVTEGNADATKMVMDLLEKAGLVE